MKTLKKNSPLWQKAVKYSRRKHVMSKPISLNESGDKVIMQSLIRGNVWERTETELDLLIKSSRNY